ncbi:MAG: hypothetical protein JGK17_12520 [Microcoleus sp. PH2017_10_PVI_O_A]|uniref:hypothetical protein n=1 Tax=unclassified Microcoleus TaxID=2642155 RepID=UPI001D25E2D7|nr:MULTISPECIES: hypothetical protein [unclassified Microcoleus]TAF22764.1 MAG: hypothetical protein EAZ73_04170 [Oscillatoriales cyanobacterium]MCC3406388.1 hypothetical protein [Microcoleus sp. PH2017_10_PVI_O_A]MCC3459015.1 hypothetical protein [Microcoleus sp. PH2017_11_PCY_U_A]MCC3477846.1 hypothetical protein [Microcoleus sp. PH2017_12_PCY_D_A]MCC3527789.1 hypothetical protein [Microcoleus sp. PH2017_21_RUC_O_A]
MLATLKHLCCLREPTRILSRTRSLNNWLASAGANSDSPIVADCRPLENSNQRCNQHSSELNSPIDGWENRHSTDRWAQMGEAPGSCIRDPIDRALRTAVNHGKVHQINTIAFGGDRSQAKFAPGVQANNQKFVQMPQAVKSSTFTAKRGSSGALTTPLSIKCFAVLSQKLVLEASPFLSWGGVSKHP